VLVCLHCGAGSLKGIVYQVHLMETVTAISRVLATSDQGGVYGAPQSEWSGTYERGLRVDVFEEATPAWLQAVQSGVRYHRHA
jgi:hypothetical protein